MVWPHNGSRGFRGWSGNCAAASLRPGRRCHCGWGARWNAASWRWRGWRWRGVVWGWCCAQPNCPSPPGRGLGSRRRRRCSSRFGCCCRATLSWLCARGTRRGGGGNRTRVLQRFGESSPSAVAGELSGGCGQRHPASRRSRLCVSPPPRRHGRRASPADDGTGARRTGATGPNSQPEIRLRAPDRLDRRWRLYLFPALFRGSGDHGSLLSLQPSKSKPITPKVVAEATLCGSRSAGYHPSCRFA